MKKLLILTTIASLILMGCAPATDSKDDSDDPVATIGDGDASAPVKLTLGQVWSGKVGDAYSNDYSSFYTFNSGSNTSLMIEVTSSSLPHDEPFANYGFLIFEGTTALVASSDNTRALDSVAPILTNLKPNTDYTLQLMNWGTEATTYQIQVKTPPTSANEGSVAAPVILTRVLPHTGYTTNVDGGKSYYKINTGGHTSVTVSYTNRYLSATLYRNSDFTTYEGGEDSPSYASVTIADLQANTDYYLAMDFSWFSDYYYRCTFDLTVTGN